MSGADAQRAERMFGSDGDIMEEAERAAKQKTSLELLQEQLKKKELKAVDHSTVEYRAFRKKLYIIPRVLNLPDKEVQARRAALEIKVRGKGASWPRMQGGWLMCKSTAIRYVYECRATCMRICVLYGGAGRWLTLLMPTSPSPSLQAAPAPWRPGSRRASATASCSCWPSTKWPSPSPSRSRPCRRSWPGATSSVRHTPP